MPAMIQASGRPPLDGVRILDASSFLSGPYVALILGDLGAHVVKVERPPNGDPCRYIGHRFAGRSAMHENLNRNKRSILLDLKNEADRATFLDLARESDVLLQNWRPGVAEELALGDAVLAATNPALVRVVITGFGVDGPYAERPVFDAVIQAATGLADRNRTAGRPELVRTTIVDKVTSVLAVQAILAALVARASNGVGERIELSMLDAMAYFNFPDMMDSRTFLEDPARAKPPRVPASMIVATSDGHIVVAPGTGVQLWAAASVAGHPEWREETRGVHDPVERLDVVMRLIETATKHEPTAVWLERFAAADVPVARILDVDAHLGDPQVVHNDLYRETLLEGVGGIRSPRYPARFVDRGPQAPSTPAPGLGEHGPEIRAELERRRASRRSAG